MVSAPIVTLEDVRAEGLPVEVASDGAVAAAIALAGEYIDRATGQWFEPVPYTADAPLLVDGSGIDTLELPAPVLQLDGVVEDSAALALTDLVVYNRKRPDDRCYPRIVKKAVSTFGVGGATFYAGYGGARSYGPRVAPRWRLGSQTVALAGTFGYCDGTWRGPYDLAVAYAFDDAVIYGGLGYLAKAASTGVLPGSDPTKWLVGLAPLLIKRTALRLVMRGWRQLTDPEETDARATARVVSESTDGHSYTLAGLVASAGITGDPAIDDVLAMYRRRYGGTTRSLP